VAQLIGLRERPFSDLKRALDALSQDNLLAIVMSRLAADQHVNDIGR
jgi:hypothetical protein